MDDARQFCTFYLDGFFIGVEVRKVQEVIRCQEMTHVPLASRVACALLNLRGEIVTAIDLRCRLQLGERAADQLPVNVVVRTDDGVVSLLVDEVGHVLDLEEDIFEPLPASVKGTAREFIRGVYKLKDRLLLVLDTEKIVNFDAASHGAEA